LIKKAIDVLEKVDTNPDAVQPLNMKNMPQ